MRVASWDPGGLAGRGAMSSGSHVDTACLRADDTPALREAPSERSTLWNLAFTPPLERGPQGLLFLLSTVTTTGPVPQLVLTRHLMKHAVVWGAATHTSTLTTTQSSGLGPGTYLCFR